MGLDSFLQVRLLRMGQEGGAGPRVRLSWIHEAPLIPSDGSAPLKGPRLGVNREMSFRILGGECPADASFLRLTPDAALVMGGQVEHAKGFLLPGERCILKSDRRSIGSKVVSPSSGKGVIMEGLKRSGEKEIAIS